MEPMVLGSPNGSPAPNAYLPSYLMGDSMVMSSPRSNMLSPNKASRNVSYIGATSPQSPEYNRYLNRYSNVSPLTGSVNNLTTNVTSPPTRGLFDSFADDHINISAINRNSQLTPRAGSLDNLAANAIQNITNSAVSPPTKSLFDTLNEDIHPQQATAIRAQRLQQQLGANTSINSQYNTDNNINNNASLRTDSLYNDTQNSFRLPVGNIVGANLPYNQSMHEFWITVFGFPTNARDFIIEHFAEIGNIIEKELPKQNSNWMHLKYLSRLECDRALNYNGRILGNLMIGVKYRSDKHDIDRANDSLPQSPSRPRQLTEIPFKSPNHNTSVYSNEQFGHKTPGLLNKAMEWVFGW